MKWQEYQDAVAELYEQLGGIGTVERNVRIPDKDTGQDRQIDVLLTIESKGHTLRVVIDAKFRADVLDVKDVEEVFALAQAINACKAAIVCMNGWTEPAGRKAVAIGMDLRILDLEEALDLFVDDKWQMCPACEADCIVMDQDGFVQFAAGGILWWLAGQCRECRFGFAWCQDCGENMGLQLNEIVKCGCGRHWTATNDGIDLELSSEDDEDHGEEDLH